jgi:hypothetical protein
LIAAFDDFSSKENSAVSHFESFMGIEFYDEGDFDKILGHYYLSPSLQKILIFHEILNTYAICLVATYNICPP